MNYQFYHIYPLGMLNKLQENNSMTLRDLIPFSEHLKSININAMYLGPVFESVYHGYDTIDYYKVDSRLGNNEDLKEMINHYHHQGIKVILDCVFNHVSRRFFALKDVIHNKENSQYKDWFYIDFSKNNYHNDGFTYGDWDGHDDLVKLNLSNHDVREYLINTALFWMDEFNIDGLRMDAADVMDRSFMNELIRRCREKKQEFFVVGEIVHGDYKGLLDETHMDSVTNYECYKGLYSSLNDSNYYEIAHSFKRLMGKGGVVKDYSMYNFVDNHDVNRIASELKHDEHLYPLYLMMYTMKGYPSIYYKSELGVKGKRNNHSDAELRQPFYINEIQKETPLLKAIQKFSEIRKENDILAFGNYEELVVDHKMIGYVRSYNNKNLLVLINSDQQESIIDKSILNHWKYQYGLKGEDLLNNEYLDGQHLRIYGNWGRIIA